MEAFLQRVADSKDVTDLIDCELSEVSLLDATPSPITALSRVCYLFLSTEILISYNMM